MKDQKHLFNLRDGIHYLNCAYKSPMLRSSEQAAIDALKRERNPVDIAPIDFFREVDEARELFGEMINCLPSEVAILPSVSYGISSVLNNIAYEKGKHALTVDNEFPSNYFPLKKWCDTNDAKLQIIKPDGQEKLRGKNWNDRIIDSINEETAIVNISSIHWMNGLKFDLEKIGEKCYAVGAKFIVDGSQSVGALPMDVKKFKIDALICAGYKWLFGPYSVCLAYIGSAFNDGIPLEEAWMNRSNAINFSDLADYDPKYKPNAARYNVGETSNFILMPMLNKALKQINEWSPAGIQTYCENLIKPLQAYLQDLGVELESKTYSTNHLFGLKLPDEINSNLLKERLKENNVYVSVRGDSLRVSANVFNITEDIEKLIEVIEKTKNNTSP